jgi:hypothetical protein
LNILKMMILNKNILIKCFSIKSINLIRSIGKFQGNRFDPSKLKDQILFGNKNIPLIRSLYTQRLNNRNFVDTGYFKSINKFHGKRFCSNGETHFGKRPIDGLMAVVCTSIVTVGFIRQLYEEYLDSYEKGYNNGECEIMGGVLGLPLITLVCFTVSRFMWPILLPVTASIYYETFHGEND